MKPFWKRVSVAQSEAGFAVLLDGKPVKLPGGKTLAAPNAALAEALAEEWRHAGLAGTDIGPDDLSLTRLTTTAQTRIPPAKDDIIRQLTAYGLNDLLCYRAGTPESLAAREHAFWQPWLDWARAAFGVALIAGSGIIPVSQPAGTAARFAAALHRLGPYQLAALGVAVPAMGSLVLGLALVAGKLDADTAFDLALLEELFQAERWGADQEAEGRRACIRAELGMCARFLQLAAG